MMVRVILILMLAFAPVGAVFAVEPDEMLEDPVLEARARDVSQQLRCVVCQNQDIDSSNAGIARDMRLLVRERIVAGDSNADILDFMVARYGNFVLLRPPFTPQTYALWFAPLVLALFAGGVGMAVIGRVRRQSARPDDLTEAEGTAIQALLDADAKDETQP
jgi:cytochrome c-type biogenesis protein CcmH